MIQWTIASHVKWVKVKWLDHEYFYKQIKYMPNFNSHSLTRLEKKNSNEWEGKCAQFYSLRDYVQDLNPWPDIIMPKALSIITKESSMKNITHTVLCVWSVLQYDCPFLTLFKGGFLLFTSFSPKPSNKILKFQQSVLLIDLKMTNSIPTKWQLKWNERHSVKQLCARPWHGPH